MADKEPIRPAESESPAAPEAGSGRSASTAAASDAELARLRAELEEAKNRALRGWAELENYRKRANRQIEDERRYAALPLLRDLLPVLDNVKRAVESADKTHDTAGLLEGIKMVVQQLETALARHHCTPIAALGQPFDPNFHDAILHQPAADVPPNTVIQEVHQGFQLHDRVVRPSQVIVSSPAAAAKREAPGGRDEKPGPAE
jgi:molecular chaperone GrpE